MWAWKGEGGVKEEGAKGKGTCRKGARVSGCEAMHCMRARALQTRLDCWAVSVGGLMAG